jgi:hypothetical protein
MTRLLIPGNAEIRAKVAAQVTAAAEIVSEAPARLHDRCLLVKTGFDPVKIVGVLLFVPASYFQFTWLSHPDFLRLTTTSQRTQSRTLFTANVRFLEILLSEFLVLLFNLFGSFEFWPFEFLPALGW